MKTANQLTFTTYGASLKLKPNWHAPTKHTTSYFRVKDISVSEAGGRYPKLFNI